MLILNHLLSLVSFLCVLVTFDYFILLRVHVQYRSYYRCALLPMIEYGEAPYYRGTLSTYILVIQHCKNLLYLLYWILSLYTCQYWCSRSSYNPIHHGTNSEPLLVNTALVYSIIYHITEVFFPIMWTCARSMDMTFLCALAFMYTLQYQMQPMHFLWTTMWLTVAPILLSWCSNTFFTLTLYRLFSTQINLSTALCGWRNQL